MKLPQLSLRELFLLVALVAMGCGWWVRERQLANRIGRAAEWCNAIHGDLLIMQDSGFIQIDTDQKTGKLHIWMMPWVKEALGNWEDNQRDAKRVADESP